MKSTSEQKTARALESMQYFLNAAEQLFGDWIASDHAGDQFQKDYPFESDFGDICNNIKIWVKTSKSSIKRSYSVDGEEPCSLKEIITCNMPDPDIAGDTDMFLDNMKEISKLELHEWMSLGQSKIVRIS